MSKMSVEVVAVDALRADDWRRWRRFQEENPALSSPYFRPEFTRVVGAISPNAAVAVYRLGDEVVGYFPHQNRSGSVQPLGAPMNDYHGLIAAPDAGISLEAAMSVLNARRINVTAWVGNADAGDERRTLQVEIDEGGFEAWYAERRALQGKYFKDKERARRSFEAEWGEIRVEYGSRDPELLDTLIGWKRDQYRRSRRHDIFACGWTRDVLHALLRHEGEGFGASVAALWAGDRLAALEYALHADDQYHFWFPAYETSMARCSPGILLTLETMRLAAKDGYRVMDFGYEGERYKQYMCNASRTVRAAVLRRPGLDTAMKHAAYGALHLVGANGVKQSFRHRWAAIEACEVSAVDRVKGAVDAVGAGLAKLSRRPTVASLAPLTSLSVL